MGIIVEERPKSRAVSSGDRGQFRLQYLVTGTADEQAAKAAALLEAPSEYVDASGVFQYQSCEAEPTSIIEEIPDVCTWDVTVTYGWERRRLQTGEHFVTFETGGQTYHRVYSLAHKGSYPEGVFDPQGLIGVQKDSVEGVDLVEPSFKRSETWCLDNAQVTDAYQRTVAVLTGRINQSAFRGFQPGEVLFCGARGSQRGEADWEITFSFEMHLNNWNLQVGTITGIRKEGWDYLWERFIDGHTPDGTRATKVLESVHVDQVLPYGDFSLLGIGV